MLVPGVLEILSRDKSQSGTVALERGAARLDLVSFTKIMIRCPRLLLLVYKFPLFSTTVEICIIKSGEHFLSRSIPNSSWKIVTYIFNASLTI